MRAEPWGLVSMDHGSSTIRCTPTNHTEAARNASGDINICRQNCSENHFISILPLNLSKTILIMSYTHRFKGILGNPSK